MNILLNDLRKSGFKPMNKTDFRDYCDKIISGDISVKHEFITRCLFIVASVIKKHNYIFDDDMIMLGLEVIMRLVDKMDRVETFFSYLYVSIKYALLNEQIKRCKIRNTQFSIHKHFSDDSDDTFEVYLEDKRIDINEYVSKFDFLMALNNLTELEREIVQKWCIDSLTINEISEMLSIKEKNVAFIKDCAVKKLTIILSNYVSKNTQVKCDKNNADQWDFLLTNIAL